MVWARQEVRERERKCIYTKGLCPFIYAHASRTNAPSHAHTHNVHICIHVHMQNANRRYTHANTPT